MPTNQGFTMTTKSNNNNLIPLYPITNKSQVIDWNIGEVFGPYQFTLTANGWNLNNQQIVSMPGITSDDIPYCVKVLSGTVEEMIAQDTAYGLLDPKIGIQSLNNQIRFTCVSVPEVDFTVQVSWRR